MTVYDGNCLGLGHLCVWGRLKDLIVMVRTEGAPWFPMPALTTRVMSRAWSQKCLHKSLSWLLILTSAALKHHHYQTQQTLVQRTQCIAHQPFCCFFFLLKNNLTSVLWSNGSRFFAPAQMQLEEDISQQQKSLCISVFDCYLFSG